MGNFSSSIVTLALHQGGLSQDVVAWRDSIVRRRIEFDRAAEQAFGAGRASGLF